VSSQSQLSLKEVCFTDTSQEIARWSKRPALHVLVLLLTLCPLHVTFDLHTILKRILFLLVPQSWRAVQAFETIGIIIVFISFFFHLMRWVTTYYRKVLYNLCHKLAFGTQIAAGTLTYFINAV
jgi:hypothetical protein